MYSCQVAVGLSRESETNELRLAPADQNSLDQNFIMDGVPLALLKDVVYSHRASFNLTQYT